MRQNVKKIQYPAICSRIKYKQIRIFRQFWILMNVNKFKFSPNKKYYNMQTNSKFSSILWQTASM